jgi:multiple sugar transport system permease protein
MANPDIPKRRKKINWAPYILILPSLVYLALFFAWPTVQALMLAVREEGVLLTIREEPERGTAVVGRLTRGAQITILDRQANEISPAELDLPGLITENWFEIRVQDPEAEPVEGWASERRIRVRETDEDGNPVWGTIRPVIGAEADPLMNVHERPSETSDVIARLEPATAVDILDQTVLEIWFLVQGEVEGQTVEGWAQSRYVRVFGDTEQGRIDRGDTGIFTTRFIQRMLSDRFFMPAFTTTLLLMVLIIPFQFVLAIIMALVIQSNLKGSSIFLGIFAIALGVSDLAVGIVWYSVFTHLGYLNSILQTLGFINAPITWLSADSRHWIIFAIWMAEIWRATAIVMVVVVSGMQAISKDVLEAAEIFGATLWQRIRYIILPLLKPSLQVALILRTILAFQVFAVVIVLGGGDVVTVLARETYRQYYALRNFNVAAVYASFILLLSMISAFFYLRAIRTQEETLE